MTQTLIRRSTLSRLVLPFFSSCKYLYRAHTHAFLLISSNTDAHPADIRSFNEHPANLSAQNVTTRGRPQLDLQFPFYPETEESM